MFDLKTERQLGRPEVNLQLYGTVIRAHDLRENGARPDKFRDLPARQEVVNTPPQVSLPECRNTLVPVCILFWFFVEHPETVRVS